MVLCEFSVSVCELKTRNFLGFFYKTLKKAILADDTIFQII